MEEEQKRKPNEFYFAIHLSEDEDDYGSYVVVIEKTTWDEENHWNDNWEDMATEHLETMGYHEMMECCYEIPLSMTFEMVKKELEHIGYTYNPEILSNNMYV